MSETDWEQEDEEDEEYEDGFHPIHHLTRTNQTKEIGLSLDSRVDPNIRGGKDAHTPLHLSAR